MRLINLVLIFVGILILIVGIILFIIEPAVLAILILVIGVILTLAGIILALINNSQTPSGSVKTLLLIRPLMVGDDYTENFSSKAAEDIKTKAQAKNWTVVDLDGPNAIQSNVNNALNNNNNISFIVHYGHGNQTTLGGQLNQAVIDNSNVIKLAGKAVSVVACLSAVTLGNQAILNGAIAYLGHNDEYWPYYEDQTILDEFILAAQVANENLLKGMKFVDAKNLQYDEYDKLYQKYSGVTAGAVINVGAAICALQNRETLTLIPAGSTARAYP